MAEPDPPADARLTGAPSIIDGLELVIFHWAGLAFGLQAIQVRGLGAIGSEDAVSIGDLLGLADTPASDLAAVDPPERLLRVDGPEGEWTCRVQEPVIQIRLRADSVHPLPTLLAACPGLNSVRAIARWRSDSGLTLLPLLDARRLPPCPLGWSGVEHAV